MYGAGESPAATHSGFPKHPLFPPPSATPAHLITLRHSGIIRGVVQVQLVSFIRWFVCYVATRRTGAMEESKCKVSWPSYKYCGEYETEVCCRRCCWCCWCCRGWCLVLWSSVVLPRLEKSPEFIWSGYNKYNFPPLPAASPTVLTARPDWASILYTSRYLLCTWTCTFKILNPVEAPKGKQHQSAVQYCLSRIEDNQLLTVLLLYQYVTLVVRLARLRLILTCNRLP